MLKNFLIATWRHFRRNRLFVLINVGGLAIGLAVFILLGRHAWEEFSYDRQWEHADRLYRFRFSQTVGPQTFVMTSVPGLVKNVLPDFFPGQFELIARQYYRGNHVRIGDSDYQTPVVLVDPEFVELFQLDYLAGSPQAVFSNPGMIALSESQAETWFGHTQVLGERLQLQLADGSFMDYEIAAVYRVPGRTFLNLPTFAWLHLEGASEYRDSIESRNDVVYIPTLVRLDEHADIERLRASLPDFVDQHLGFIGLGRGKPSEMLEFDLQKLSDIHFNPSTGEQGGNRSTVLGFLLVAALVLLVAGLNFVVLTTAKASRRAREVALRKTLGASRSQLALQYLGESFLLFFLALLLALALARFALPAFVNLSNQALDLDLASAEVLAALPALLALLCLLAGLYPALVLARFRPAETLKAHAAAHTGGSATVRAALVLVQFAAAILLMIATAVIYLQLDMARRLDPGFERRNMYTISLFTEDVRERMDALHDAVASLPAVLATSLSSRQPNSIGGGTQYLRFRVAGREEAPPEMLVMNVDHGFAATYRIPVLAGRFFDADRDPYQRASENEKEETSAESAPGKIVLNASAARQLGFAHPEDALGRYIDRHQELQATSAQPNSYQVIGVIEDTQFRSLRGSREPELYLLAPPFTYFLTLRFAGDTQAMRNALEQTWREVVNERPLPATLLETFLDQEFRQEDGEGRILVTASLLAIVIACMGLYGMAAFTINRRLREISLRKVMGADDAQILRLLLRQFSVPVLLANLLAWPAAWLAAQHWLERFPYRIEPWSLLPIALGASLLALLIAWLTVGGMAWRAARTPPALCLRQE